MKNLKRKVIWLVGVIAWFWLIFSFAVDIRQLKTDLSNAVQHFQKIKIISLEEKNKSYAEIQYVWSGLLWIDTNNFILSQSGSDGSKIGNWWKGSSILWWSGNKIGNNSYSVIIWWENNNISSDYSTIIWWSDNKIDKWLYGTILWWRENILSGNGSTIIWGSNNKVMGIDSVSIWKNGVVEWDDSVWMWSDFKIKGYDSFLWNGGDEIEIGSNLFVVNSEHGMVINTGKAYSFAKLTIGWPMVLNSDTVQCNSNSKWVVTLKEGVGVKCFCSCDGENWNSIVWWKCESVCSEKIVAECGSDVYKNIDGTPYSYSWSCEKGKVIEWTWAYLVWKDDIIYRSCESIDWSVVPCVGVVSQVWEWDGGQSFGCRGELPMNAVTWSTPPPTNGATWYVYDEFLSKPCGYKCEETYDYVEERWGCIKEESASCGPELWGCDGWLFGGSITELSDRYTWYCDSIWDGLREPCHKCKDWYIEDWDEMCLKTVTFHTKLADLLKSNFPGKITAFIETELTWDWENWINISDNSERIIRAWYNTNEQVVYYTVLDAVAVYLPEDSSYMFANMSDLEEINTIKDRDTSNVTQMNNMFSNCSSLTELDLWSWDTDNVTQMDNMFYNCSNLVTIYARNWFKPAAISDAVSMFAYDDKLVWWAWTSYADVYAECHSTPGCDEDSVDNAYYARPDGRWQRWYFTSKAVCPAGYYEVGGNCEACPGWTYSQEWAYSCVACSSQPLSDDQYVVINGGKKRITSKDNCEMVSNTNKDGCVIGCKSWYHWEVREAYTSTERVCEGPLGEGCRQAFLLLPCSCWDEDVYHEAEAWCERD